MVRRFCVVVAAHSSAGQKDAIALPRSELGLDNKRILDILVSSHLGVLFRIGPDSVCDVASGYSSSISSSARRLSAFWGRSFVRRAKAKVLSLGAFCFLGIHPL